MTTQHLLKMSLCAVVALAAGQAAHAAVWTGGGAGDEYSTAGNWDDGLVPASLSTQDINGAFTVERSVDSVAGRTFIRGGGVMNVTGGTHNDNRSGASIYNFLGDGSEGTVNQSGGSYSIGHSLRIGTGNNVNSDGTYNLTGGDLIVYRGSNSAIDSSNPGGRPSMEIGFNGTGTGLFQISGGSLATRAGVHVGDGGTFSVVGSGATSIGIGSNQSADGVWLQAAGSVLSAKIDAGGVTSIFIDDMGGGTIFAEFRSGSLLDLDFEGVAPVAGTWTILEAEGVDISDLGLGLATGVDSNWSFNIDNSGANGLLTATYVPEPSSLALLGLGGLLIARRRRGA